MFKLLSPARRNTNRPSRAVEHLESRTLFAVPAGFTETRIATGLAQPVAMAFAPDGRLFITEKPGGVRVIDAGGQLLSQKFMQLTVNTEGERGALGIVHDPDFLTNGHLYVYYTATTPTIHNRLSRFTAADANPDPAAYAPGNTVEAGSETVLMEFDTLNSIYHNAGSLHFGPDGKLYVSVGDNVRGGETQSLSSRWGKILRLNRDGTIPADNPFYSETTGDNRAIWALGLRNAFTFAFQPGTNRMYINEVGNYSFEEINDGRAGGNYGWPDTEGPTTDPRFDAPIYSYANNGVCNAITGALFYNPSGGASQLPAEYVGKYFFGDLCGGMDAGTANGWIKTLDPVTKQVQNFGTQIQRPVDYDIGPDGAFYYLSNSRPGNAGHVYRVTYAGTSTDLNITVQPEDVTASVGLPATFSVQAAGSGTITYQWQRNGVNIPGATSATYELSSAQLSDTGATFRVVVSNGSQTLTSSPATLTVTSNQPPVPTITLPATGTVFAGGQEIAFAGTASDPEDGALPASAFTWRVDYLTGDIERQGMPDTPGIREGTFTAASQTPFTSTDVRYRVVLTVRDSEGLESSTSVDLHPQVGTMGLATSPADRGLKLTLDGQPLRGAGSSEGVVGVERVLVAPASQVINGVTYSFVNWSDGQTAATRTVVTAAQPFTLTANYAAQNDGTGDASDADLTAAVVRPPAATLIHRAPARMLVRLTNAGGAAVSGPVRFDVVASADAFVDPDDPVVATVERPVRLAPGRSRGVRLDFTPAASVPAGSYLMLVRADGAGAVTETAEHNNVAATAAPVTVSPATIDLTGTVATVRVTARAPRQALATLLLRNEGNTAFNGPVTLSLLASPDATADSSDPQLVTLPARTLRLRPGGRRAIRLRADVSALAPGTYHLGARVASSGPIVDVNAADNDVVSSATFTVA